MTETTTLPGAIRNATAGDLAAVEGRIAELTCELESLRLLQKVLARRLGAAPPPSAPAPKPRERHPGGRPPSPETTALRKSLALKLAQEGVMTPARLAGEMGLDLKRVDRLLSHPWFSEDDDGFRITPEGRQACC